MLSVQNSNPFLVLYCACFLYMFYVLNGLQSDLVINLNLNFWKLATSKYDGEPRHLG